MLKVKWILPFVILGLALAWFATPEACFANSPADCQAYAKRVEMDSGSMLGGAARGAARGAIFGAIIGDSKHAKRGAGLGAIVGGTRTAVGKSEVYRRAYDDCMAGRVKF
jgi:hypothetical protein